MEVVSRVPAIEKKRATIRDKSPTCVVEFNVEKIGTDISFATKVIDKVSSASQMIKNMKTFARSESLKQFSIKRRLMRVKVKEDCLVMSNARPRNLEPRKVSQRDDQGIIFDAMTLQRIALPSPTVKHVNKIRSTGEIRNSFPGPSKVGKAVVYKPLSSFGSSTNSSSIGNDSSITMPSVRCNVVNSAQPLTSFYIPAAPSVQSTIVPIHPNIPSLQQPGKSTVVPIQQTVPFPNTNIQPFNVIKIATPPVTIAHRLVTLSSVSDQEVVKPSVTRLQPLNLSSVRVLNVSHQT